MSGASWTSWFHPRLSTSWIQDAATTLGIVLLLLMILEIALRPRFSGPLLANERRAADRDRFRRWFGNAIVPLAALASIASVATLLWSVGPPTTLVLHSRARARDRVGNLVVSGQRTRDLGAIVDRVLARCHGVRAGAKLDSCAPSADGDSKTLQSFVQEAVLAEEAPLVDNNDAYLLPSLGDDGLSREVIESAELAVVSFAIRRWTPVEVRVAPARTEGLSSWDVFDAMTETESLTVSLVNRQRTTAQSPRVRTAAGGRLTKNGHFSFWAIVEGPVDRKFPLPVGIWTRRRDDTKLAQLQAVISTVVEPDTYRARLVSVQGDIVDRSRPLCTSSDVVIARVATHGMAKQDMELRCPEKDDVRLVSVVDGDANRLARALERWKQTLARPEMQGFADDLSILDALPIPSIAPNDPTAIAMVRRATAAGEVVVVALRRDDAREIARRIAASAEPASKEIQRIIENQIGTSSTFSGMGLASAADTSLPFGTPLSVAAIHDGAISAAPMRKKSIERISTGSIDGRPWIALRLHDRLDELLSVAPPRDPLQAASILRELSWAVRAVKIPDVSLDADEGHGESGPLVAPALGAAQIEELIGKAQRDDDRWRVFAIGLLIATALWSAFRAGAPPKRA